jgi:SRSO17 transposase
MEPGCQQSRALERINGVNLTEHLAIKNQKLNTFLEIIYGKKRAITYWEITTDPETMPENSTTYVMTNLRVKLKKILGDLYGLRTWVEYGFRQCKQELGWTDYRFTNFQHIERW